MKTRKLNFYHLCHKARWKMQNANYEFISSGTNSLYETKFPNFHSPSGKLLSVTQTQDFC